MKNETGTTAAKLIGTAQLAGYLVAAAAAGAMILNMTNRMFDSIWGSGPSAAPGQPATAAFESEAANHEGPSP